MACNSSGGVSGTVAPVKKVDTECAIAVPFRLIEHCTKVADEPQQHLARDGGRNLLAG
jgi:hypothetical protein